MDFSTFERFSSGAALSGVIFFYAGEFSSPVVAAAADIVKQRLQGEDTSGATRRKLFSSFVEMAQNITHYAVEGDPTRPGVTNGKHGAIAVGQSEAGHFWIACANRVDVAHVPGISDKLNRLRTMSLDEIRQHYRAQLHNTDHETENPGSRGAGLGLLTIARDSTAPLEFCFASDPAQDGHNAYFYVKAVI
jgi:hypothetical protein